MSSTVKAGTQIARPPRWQASAALALSALATVLWAGKLALLPVVRAYRAGPSATASLRAADLLGTFPFAILLILGTAVIFRSGARSLGWLLLGTGFGLSLMSFAAEYSVYAYFVDPRADLPLASLAAWLQDQWMVVFFLMASLPFAFPDGRLPSRRWGTVYRVLGGGWLALAALWAFSQRPVGNQFEFHPVRVPNPAGLLPLVESWKPLAQQIFQILLALLLIAFVLTGLASLAARFRSADPDRRQQIRWVVFSAAPVLAALLFTFLNTVVLPELLGERLLSPGASNGLYQLSLAGLGLGTGVAVLKYRLYDLDFVLSRALAYGVLTLLIVAGFVTLVSAVGAFLPDSVGLFPSLVATAVIAVLFSPLRERLQGAADRLVYGERKRPYEVLRTLSGHLAASGQAATILPSICATIGKSLKLPYVFIQLEGGNETPIRASYGARQARQVEFPLYDQALHLGHLSVGLPRGERELLPETKDLLKQIALWLGPVAQASVLAQELRLAHSRVLAARAEERRRLYRDLHDGLGPTLASQTFRFDRALEALERDPDMAAKILSALKMETQGMIQEIRRLVYQLRSSSLDELGLLGSLRESIPSFQAQDGELEIELIGSDQELSSLPAAHEQALQRIALEALTNVARHSGARRCRIILKVPSGIPSRVQMTIEDDGRGLRPSDSPGVGIPSMLRRAEAMGGSLRIDGANPQGTRIVVDLPLSTERSGLVSE